MSPAWGRPRPTPEERAAIERRRVLASAAREHARTHATRTAQRAADTVALELARQRRRDQQQLLASARQRFGPDTTLTLRRSGWLLDFDGLRPASDEVNGVLLVTLAVAASPVSWILWRLLFHRGWTVTLHCPRRVVLRFTRYDHAVEGAFAYLRS